MKKRQKSKIFLKNYVRKNYLEKLTKLKNRQKLKNYSYKKLIFVSDAVHKQAKINEKKNYRAARKEANFGSKPVEPKTKLLS